MISKKICMLGAFSVGKTSLVGRYVNSIFSDSYISTVGVKISKKQVKVKEQDVNIILWDMEGKDDFVDVNLSYLKGAMGYFIVVDLTRKETLEIALQIRKNSIALIGEDIPNIILLNKADIEVREVTDQQITELANTGIHFLLTSAKTGENVENAFNTIAEQMLS